MLFGYISNMYDVIELLLDAIIFFGGVHMQRNNDCLYGIVSK